MTPKQKAKELIEKYIDLTDECNCLEYSCVCFTMHRSKAKQCALIAIDEILYMIIGSTPTINYWKKVKTEIKKYDR